MSRFTATVLDLCGWNRISGVNGVRSNILSDDTANEYAGLTALEVAALFTRLADARRAQQATAAAGSTQGEPRLSSASADAAPTCWEDDHNSGAHGSSSTSVCISGSGGNGCNYRGSSATGGLSGARSNVQEAEPLPADACQGPSSPPEMHESPCSLQQHATAQAQQPWYLGVDLRQHTLMGHLGTGAYGTVALAAVELPDGRNQRMAVKSLVMLEQPVYPLRVARREVEGMQAMQGSPHALQLYGSTFDYIPPEELDQPRNKYQIFMELAEIGNLKKELDAAVLARPRGERSKREGLLLPETRVAEVAYVLLSALTHMNRQGYAHCDIKPDNVFVMADGSCRLGDPGVACAADTSGVLHHAAGSLGYCSPEMEAKLFDRPCHYPVTLKTDVYSVARVLALCAVWYDRMLSWERYVRWEEDLPECVPAGLRDLIASMVEEDPAKRPSPLEALDHPWLVSVLRGEQQQQQQPSVGTATEAVAAVEVAATGPSPADAWW